MSDPFATAVIVAVCAVLFVLLVWGAIAEILRIRRGEQEAVQPLNARPVVAPRCQAGHCSNAAMPTPVPHVDGTEMLVCPGDLERGCREGWIVQEVAS
jgi:hypothetical protein